MGAVVLPAKSDPSDPFVDEPGILPAADMIGMINPAREGVVVESPSSTFEPSEQTATCRLEEFELNGAAGFLLDYDGSRANPAAADKVADLDLGRCRTRAACCRSRDRTTRDRVVGAPDQAKI